MSTHLAVSLRFLEPIFDGHLNWRRMIENLCQFSKCNHKHEPILRYPRFLLFVWLIIRFFIKSCLIQDIWDLHICELLFDEILVQRHLHNYVVHYSGSQIHFALLCFAFSLFHFKIISPGQSCLSQSARIGWLVP